MSQIIYFFCILTVVFNESTPITNVVADNYCDKLFSLHAKYS